MQILVVDDNQLIRDMVSSIIVNEGYKAFTAEGAEAAHKIIDEQDIDLILTDVEMPQVDGYELTRQIRAKLHDNWVPIIFLSGQTDEANLCKGIEAGGDDYLTKPVNATILIAKINAMARIAQMKAALDEANQQLLKLTHVDPLTEAVNRRGMEEALDRAWRIHNREGTELSVIMLDIDHFKPYNDNYGHPQGDLCLQEFSALVQKQLFRPADMLARYGGEEFLVILPNTPIEGAQIIAKKVIRALASKAMKHEHSSAANFVTASMGLSSTRFDAKGYDELIAQADEALYKAKSNGRNNFVKYSELG